MAEYLDARVSDDRVKVKHPRLERRDVGAPGTRPAFLQDDIPRRSSSSEGRGGLASMAELRGEKTPQKGHIPP
jgi:hypothetical protein